MCTWFEVVFRSYQDRPEDARESMGMPRLKSARPESTWQQLKQSERENKARRNSKRPMYPEVLRGPGRQVTRRGGGVRSSRVVVMI